MEINVGDYVRGFRGINKVIRIEPYNNRYFYYTDGKNNNEGKPFYFERHITKHSKDIIDLVEVGDYVNGYKVMLVNKNCLMLSNGEIVREIKINDKIVTKEQYASMEYKVN